MALSLDDIKVLPSCQLYILAKLSRYNYCDCVESWQVNG